MLKLLGSPISNYYNMVKCALIEKGIEFEEVPTPPSQEDDFIKKSPMGKIPCLETEAGCLSETIAILDYLEEAYPDKPLLPADPYERAKVRELVVNLELNIELVARKAFNILRGKPVPAAIKEEVAQTLPRGARAIATSAKFSPFIAGNDFTIADIVGFHTFVYATRVGEEIGVDFNALIPGLQTWYDKVGERESIQKALADQKR